MVEFNHVENFPLRAKTYEAWRLFLTDLGRVPEMCVQLLFVSAGMLIGTNGVVVLFGLFPARPDILCEAILFNFVFYIVNGFFIFFSACSYYGGVFFGRISGILFLGDFEVRASKRRRFQRLEKKISGRVLRLVSIGYLVIVFFFSMFIMITNSNPLMVLYEFISWTLPVVASILPLVVVSRVLWIHLFTHGATGKPRALVAAYCEGAQTRHFFSVTLGALVALGFIAWVNLPAMFLALNLMLSSTVAASWVPEQITLMSGQGYLEYMILLLNAEHGGVLGVAMKYGLPVIFITLTVQLIAYTLGRVYLQYRVYANPQALWQLLVSTLKTLLLFLFVEIFTREIYLLDGQLNPSWLTFLLIANFILAMDHEKYAVSQPTT